MGVHFGTELGCFVLGSPLSILFSRLTKHPFQESTAVVSARLFVPSHPPEGDRQLVRLHLMPAASTAAVALTGLPLTAH